jgi:hypothetical protein
MGFFSGLFHKAGNTLSNLYHAGTRALGSALWSGAKAVAPYLFPAFYSKEAIGARNQLGNMFNNGLNRAFEFGFTGH